MQVPIRNGREFSTAKSLSGLIKCAAFFATSFVLLLWTVQLGAQSAAPADTVYARPGQLVHAGGFRLNLYCMGSGSPTVVFDPGWGDWAPTGSEVGRDEGTAEESPLAGGVMDETDCFREPTMQN